MGRLQCSPLLCSARCPGAVLWHAMTWRTGGNVERAGDWLFSHMDDLPAAIAAVKGGAAGGAGAAAAGGDAAAGNRYERLPWLCSARQLQLHGGKQCWQRVSEQGRASATPFGF